ncbi:hypothetical protein AWV80_32200 [Cupriavidus sp. UYMU48A]|nr:hypothetical protein AWV80_32200 [Cupriavidus sp. UYMU48A]
MLARRNRALFLDARAAVEAAPRVAAAWRKNWAMTKPGRPAKWKASTSSPPIHACLNLPLPPPTFLTGNPP